MLGTELIVTLYAWLPVAPIESVAVMVKLNGLSAESVGVPVIAPVLELRLRPVGKLPADTLKAMAPVPPVSPIVWLYATPTVPLGNVNVVMLGAGLMATV